VRDDVISRIRRRKIIAIVRGQPADALLPLAAALLAGGIEMMEITFSQKDSPLFHETAAGIRTLAKAFAGRLSVGAGTVMNREQARMACDAGAEYIISPNADARVIEETRKLGLVSLPGAMTPGEIAFAHEAGADFVKVFPAGILGAEYIKAVRAPLTHIPLMAVGGVDEKNVRAFMKAGVSGVGVGGRLVNAEWIAQGRFDGITRLAEEYVNAVKE
jgi:2-dehydro-3-deoxyphosphogluconate aldolase/(4S)-4-hydroxy-2-oxoglutarate aldolase